MMLRLVAPALMLAAGPALAASGPFFSLGNSNFVVLIAFVLFIGVLVYFKVPHMLGGMLDQRAEDVRTKLDEARTLREEAQGVLADFERKQREVRDQAALIVEQARSDAELAREQAMRDLEASIQRRLRAAEDQIASAEAAAVRAVRDHAVQVAVAAAGKVIAEGLSPEDRTALVQDSIATVQARLH